MTWIPLTNMAGQTIWIVAASLRMAVPETAFAPPDTRLRVWLDGGVHLLIPDTPANRSALNLPAA